MADEEEEVVGTAGFSITAISLVVGSKKGLKRLPDTNRMETPVVEICGPPCADET